MIRYQWFEERHVVVGVCQTALDKTSHLAEDNLPWNQTTYYYWRMCSRLEQGGPKHPSQNGNLVIVAVSSRLVSLQAHIRQDE